MTQEQVIASRELLLASFAQGRSTKLLSRSMPQIVRAMKDVYREPGEAVFRIGDASESVFFVASGRVELVRGEHRVSYGERMVVGTDDVLLERRRTRDAIALTHVHVLELPETTWLEILEDNVEAARGALAGMSGALDALELRYDLPKEDEPPPSMATKTDTLTIVDRLVLLRSVEPFRRARIQTLASLAGAVDVVSLAAGEKIYGASEPRHAHHIMVSGRIETTRVDPERVQRFGRGELVLGAASFVKHARFQAKALVDSVVLRLPEEAFLDVAEDHFDLVRTIFAWIAERRDKLV